MSILFAIEQFDYAFLQAVQAEIHPLFTPVMLAITFLGNPIFWVAIAAALYWRGQENRGFFMMNLVVFASAAAGVLKYAFARPRPSPADFKVMAGDGYNTSGFPSGHATIIAAGFTYCYGAIEKYLKAIFVMIVILVLYSRMYLGMHYLSDVLAGLALGIVIGKLNLIARNKLFHKNFKPSKLEDELVLVALIAVAVLAVMFLKSFPMAGMFIGFYAGFFLFKEMGASQSILFKKFLAAKYAVGFALLAVVGIIGEGIVSIGFVLTVPQAFILYAFGGFWISWLWPILFEKAFKTKTIA